MKIVETLLESDEPAVRAKVRAAMGESVDREEIRESVLASSMLNPEGPIYHKWRGAHWIIASLADLGHPGGAETEPLIDDVLDYWLGERFFAEFDCKTRAAAYARQKEAVPCLNGRYRRCGSQQGNALFSALSLGVADERCDRLAERLMHWQWPDGGWNCDKDPDASTSSFMETLTPLRALGLYARTTGDAAAAAAVDRAAEVFLCRQLYRARRDGSVIKAGWIKLHYPCYWHYDILFGLKVMAEIGKIDDPRCADALDLLESKQLADGGWPAEASYYSMAPKSRNEHVNWGGTSKQRQNAWVSADALTVLRAAGRI